MEHPKSPNKPPTDLDVEELLKQATDETKSDEHDIVEYKNDIVPFLSIYKITQGEERISSRLLYELYNNWSKESRTHSSFFREVSKYLVFKPGENQTFFLINLPASTISKEILLHFNKKAPKQLKSPKKKKAFDSFLNAHGIKAGTFFLEARILYYIYQNWAYDGGKPVMSYDAFTKFCCLYFNKKKDYKDVVWYGLNYELKHTFFTDEYLKFIRDKYYNAYLKDKKKKK